MVDGCVLGCGCECVWLLCVSGEGLCSHTHLCLCVGLGVGSRDCWGLAEPPLTWGPPGTEGGAQLPGTLDSHRFRRAPADKYSWGGGLAPTTDSCASITAPPSVHWLQQGGGVSAWAYPCLPDLGAEGCPSEYCGGPCRHAWLPVGTAMGLSQCCDRHWRKWVLCDRLYL